MNKSYFIKPCIIVMSFDDNYKNYILSKSKDNIELITYTVNDNNADCLNIAVETIQECIHLSVLDINIRLIDLHSKEIERAYNTTDTIYPLYGSVVPYSKHLLNCFWKEYLFLESNPFSYSITRVAQNIII